MAEFEREDVEREALEMMRQADSQGFITCDCGENFEPDAVECGGCGYQNPLVTLGYI